LQTPGTNAEIVPLLKYVRPGGYEPHPNLKIYGKLDVNGDKENPLFTYLKKSCPPTVFRIGDPAGIFWNPIDTRDIVWNFEKFLVDKRGVPRYRFHPHTWDFGRDVQPYLDSLLAEGNAACALTFISMSRLSALMLLYFSFTRLLLY